MAQRPSQALNPQTVVCIRRCIVLVTFLSWPCATAWGQVSAEGDDKPPTTSNKHPDFWQLGLEVGAGVVGNPRRMPRQNQTISGVLPLTVDAALAPFAYVGVRDEGYREQEGRAAKANYDQHWRVLLQGQGRYDHYTANDRGDLSALFWALRAGADAHLNYQMETLASVDLTSRRTDTAVDYDQTTRSPHWEHSVAASAVVELLPPIAVAGAYEFTLAAFNDCPSCTMPNQLDVDRLAHRPELRLLYRFYARSHLFVRGAMNFVDYDLRSRMTSLPAGDARISTVVVGLDSDFIDPGRRDTLLPLRRNEHRLSRREVAHFTLSIGAAFADGRVVDPTDTLVGDVILSVPANSADNLSFGGAARVHRTVEPSTGFSYVAVTGADVDGQAHVMGLDATITAGAARLDFADDAILDNARQDYRLTLGAEASYHVATLLDEMGLGKGLDLRVGGRYRSEIRWTNFEYQGESLEFTTHRAELFVGTQH